MTRMKPILLLALLACFPFQASAQETLLTRYIADIGPQDHYNSSGTRLNSFAALLAQDRANYHRFGIRHPHDQGDPLFNRREMRAQISANVLRVPHYYQEYMNLVLNCTQNCGTYLVVYIYGAGQKITRITIDVPG